MAKKYVAKGWSGTKGRRKLRKDILALSDEAKKKRLEANVKENQKRIKVGKKARTISDRDLDKFESKFRTSKQKIRRLQARAADYRAKANEVAENKTAAAAYRQAAKEALKRAAALKKG